MSGRRPAVWLVALCAAAGVSAGGERLAAGQVRSSASSGRPALAEERLKADAGGRTRLVDAVKTGNRDAARVLLNERTDVNASEADGTTALHWAVRHDDLDTVRRLLRAGADATVSNRYGITPLGLAATNGSATMIEALIRAGADPNAALPEGETPLMMAARTGRPEALKALLAHGADVHARESWFGENALMWAAGENHAAAVRTLIDGGANVDARSAVLTIPEWWLKPPFALFPVEFPRGGWTPLMYAARQGALDATRALADLRANLDATDPDGVTAVVLAIINAHYDVAALLLEKGADPNLADASGMAALYAAVDMRSMPFVLARPEARPSGELDHLDIVKRLIAHGADVNAPLKAPLLMRQHLEGDPGLGAGTTPFMRAAKAGDVVVMRLLAEHGADHALTQQNRSTALMIAAGLGWREGGNSTPRGDRGTEEGAIEAIRLCLALGADINAVNDSGDTALHAAVAGRGSAAIIRFLVASGAKLDAKNNQGRTPLDVAVSSRRDRTTTVTLLRELMGDAATAAPRPAAPPR
jgi:ankyrin repeat protein